MADGRAHLPARVQEAVQVYMDLIDDLNTSAKTTAALRRRVNPAKKAIETYMDENAMEALPMGDGRTYRRVVKPVPVVSKKTLEESRVVPAEIKAGFIEENTVSKSSFKFA